MKSLLSAVKADVVDFVHVRGLPLNLNFMVGKLIFTATGAVEFKSTSAMDTVSNFSETLPIDCRSKAGDDLNRGFRAMQQDQSTGCRSPILPNSNNGNSQRKVGNSNSAFATKKPYVRNQISASQDNGDAEYGHLHQFLKEQIETGKNRSICSNVSRGSKRSTANNAIIEQAAKLRYDIRAVNELVEQSKASSVCEKVPLSTLKSHSVANTNREAVRDW